MKSIPWNENEIMQLKSIYSNLNNDDVAAVIGRTSFAVEHKARKLGLQKSESFNKSEKSGKFIKKNKEQPIGSTSQTPICYDCQDGHTPIYQEPCSSCCALRTGRENRFTPKIIIPIATPEASKESFFKRIFKFFKSSAAC